jgi:4-alpha-glucanotransferase
MMLNERGEGVSDAVAVPPAAVVEALRVLGIRRLLLGIQDAAFPSRPEEDIGRGSPYGLGGREFLDFIRGLGFTGVQLGPQGMTSPTNPSPYDSSLFSRNRLSVAPMPLTTEAWGELLSGETLAELVAGRPARGALRTVHEYACQARHRILDEVGQRFQAKVAAGGLHDSVRAFALFRRQNGGWLLRDGLYEALRHHYGGRSWQAWAGGREARVDRKLWCPAPEEQQRCAARRRALFAHYHHEITAYALAQFLLDRQHRELRTAMHHLGLELFGDLQIGISGRDAWFAQSFLLPRYVMGAPPSRTNPEGQPWNYPLLDPGRYFADSSGRPGPALRFVRQRVEKMFREFDGLRIDHPHGLVCPWVYRAGQADLLAAVQAGARLFASPDLPDHPALAPFTIPRPEQINRASPRHGDAWVRELEPRQVERYAVLFEVIMGAAQAHGRDGRAIACEILSTQPYPIQRVMERHGLGRFRVTQKADMANPGDGYRSENAQPEDWVMLGNHDTPSIWSLADQWRASGECGQQAAYLAWRLVPEESERGPWAAQLAADAGELVQAKAADLFVGPAGNVMIFFTDLLGMSEIYNRPGTVSDDNWSLRIPYDYAHLYQERLARRRAINIPLALARAIRARGQAFAQGQERLLAELDQLATPRS